MAHTGIKNFYGDVVGFVDALYGDNAVDTDVLMYYADTEGDNNSYTPSRSLLIFFSPNETDENTGKVNFLDEIKTHNIDGEIYTQSLKNLILNNQVVLKYNNNEILENKFVEVIPDVDKKYDITNYDQTEFRDIDTGHTHDIMVIRDRTERWYLGGIDPNSPELHTHEDDHVTDHGHHVSLEKFFDDYCMHDLRFRVNYWKDKEKGDVKVAMMGGEEGAGYAMLRSMNSLKNYFTLDGLESSDFDSGIIVTGFAYNFQTDLTYSFNKDNIITFTGSDESTGTLIPDTSSWGPISERFSNLDEFNSKLSNSARNKYNVSSKLLRTLEDDRFDLKIGHGHATEATEENSLDDSSWNDYNTMLLYAEGQSKSLGGYDNTTGEFVYDANVNYLPNLKNSFLSNIATYGDFFVIYKPLIINDESETN